MRIPSLRRLSISIMTRWPTFLVIGYILAAYSWTMPEEQFYLKPYINAVSTRPIIFFNLWQAWDMFAPNPRNEDIRVDARFTNKDGSEGKLSLTNMIEMPYFERWQKERWRKYINDHLRLDSERILWKPFAEYVSRYLRDQGQTPVKIELNRYWRASELPVRPDLRADVRNAPWSSFTFFKLDTGDVGAFTAPDRSEK